MRHKSQALHIVKVSWALRDGQPFSFNVPELGVDQLLLGLKFTQSSRSSDTTWTHHWATVLPA